MLYVNFFPREGVSELTPSSIFERPLFTAVFIIPVRVFVFPRHNDSPVPRWLRLHPPLAQQPIKIQPQGRLKGRFRHRQKPLWRPYRTFGAQPDSPTCNSCVETLRPTRFFLQNLSGLSYLTSRDILAREEFLFFFPSPLSPTSTESRLWPNFDNVRLNNVVGILHRNTIGYWSDI